MQTGVPVLSEVVLPIEVIPMFERFEAVYCE